MGATQLSYAADLPVKGPAYKAPPAIAVYNWNGFYVGGNIGAVGTRLIPLEQT
jgi:outer membrane immunogenic protein